ncbi:MAG: hypothetical protein MI867_10545, partial [Pseudomonadales bacterium]|nr:hypothetical protein [Pseudomonadales bacterium]
QDTVQSNLQDPRGLTGTPTTVRESFSLDFKTELEGGPPGDALGTLLTMLMGTPSIALTDSRNGYTLSNNELTYPAAAPMASARQGHVFSVRKGSTTGIFEVASTDHGSNKITVVDPADLPAGDHYLGVDPTVDGGGGHLAIAAGDNVEVSGVCQDHGVEHITGYGQESRGDGVMTLNGLILTQCGIKLASGMVDVSFSGAASSRVSDIAPYAFEDAANPGRRFGMESSTIKDLFGFPTGSDISIEMSFNRELNWSGTSTAARWISGQLKPTFKITGSFVRIRGQQYAMDAYRDGKLRTFMVPLLIPRYGDKPGAGFYMRFNGVYTGEVKDEAHGIGEAESESFTFTCHSPEAGTGEYALQISRFTV